MENLLLLLNKISQVSPLGVFNQEVIIVQNPGMQHWLNLAIATERGISMNIDYALPAQFLWRLIRTLAGDDKVLEQSPYSREVLTWRIYALLATEPVTSDEDFLPATRYWQGENSAPLKRYQLAVQLADLYEQYLIFRPTWLDNWQQGNIESLASDFNQQLPGEVKWQAKLWQLLIKQQPYNPVELITEAIANIEQKIAASPNVLPKRLSFFAINTMPPIWLEFINALSEHIEVNFFHLNPCFAYWGDIISEKQAFKKLSHWSAGVDDEHLFVGNPLLANFGQQGREFLALLQGYSTVNVELFVAASSAPVNDKGEPNKPCILHQLQNDILNLDDATSSEHEHKYEKSRVVLIDDSITITSCHSAMREVQALHDYLLHQFNSSHQERAQQNGANQERANHESSAHLTPKDVLVMCPKIEQYAPYVNAVFTRGWQNLDDEVPPLPCSIADRSAKDSDPLIAAFSDLLALPDSRFQVTHLLAFIRQSAIANKFAITSEDISKISVWLEQASIHWGLDLAHKQQILGENANNNFTWQQGLSRLLRGFAFSDSDAIYQEQLLLANVEGDDALLLGKLMLFIEQLQQFSLQVTQARTPKAWQSFLLLQVEQLFARRNSSNDKNNNKSNDIDNALVMIENAIASFVEYCQQADLDEKIELSIVTDFLNNHFSQGDASKQFMVGQVTFCSMLPMRSIPFKIIAVLGLNDGEFPRQRQPLGFDLMSQAKTRLGDRSRRGDDRYLFLEAIISARQALYLSYQGRNIKNNNEKQPSLVLKELMDYLNQGYGWQFDEKSQVNNIRQMAMQPFSEANYFSGDKSTGVSKPSFDGNWLKLAQDETLINHDAKNEQLVIEPGNLSPSANETATIATATEIPASELIRFFQHPSKVFAQQALNLYLENNEANLDDVEPFTANALTSYLLRQDLLAAHLAINNAPSVEQVLHKAQLSGQFPDLPSMDENYNAWQTDSEQFAEEIASQGADNPELIACHIVIKLSENKVINLTAQVPVKRTNDGVMIIFYRSSTAKAKDLFSLYLHHLIVQCWQSQQSGATDYQANMLSEVCGSRGFYFNTKAQKVEQYFIDSLDNEQEQLTCAANQSLVELLRCYFKGQQQPLLINGDIAAQVFKQTRGKRVEMTAERFELYWQGTESSRGLGDDLYMQYFWPQCPDINEHLAEIESIYQGLYQLVEKVKSGSKA
ncbi:exodeoxyribonuclease V subunit gamma [Colwellia sp. 39_35_sub15_T18]|nr:exodeoxyribonuclease V subunit gamma [Colwellia sp. 39_35_sub15_T18]